MTHPLTSPRGPALRGGLALATVVLVTACGGGGTSQPQTVRETSARTPTTSSQSVASDTATVSIEGFEYHPSEIEVATGTSVMWTNEDMFGHTVTAGTPDEPTGQFDGTLGETTDGAGKTFSHTFTEPGTYPYFCDFHPAMRATVTVTAGAS